MTYIVLQLGVTIFGFADDGALVIEAESRIVVEHIANQALVIAHERGTRNKPRFSVEKTEALVFKDLYTRSPVL